MKLVQLSINNKGNAYFIYQVEVQRGIRKKNEKKAKELLIVGIPEKELQKYCNDHDIWITTRGVYQNNWDNMILERTTKLSVWTEITN